MTHSKIDGACFECTSGYTLLSDNTCSTVVEGCEVHDPADGTCSSCEDKTKTPSSDGERCVGIEQCSSTVSCNTTRTQCACYTGAITTDSEDHCGSDNAASKGHKCEVSVTRSNTFTLKAYECDKTDCSVCKSDTECLTCKEGKGLTFD